MMIVIFNQRTSKSLFHERRNISNKRIVSLPQKSGLTLLEMLVCIGILAVLIGLLLPAVQRVRQMAYRVGCISNVKQLGLATHGYHATQNHFPAGCDYPNAPRPKPRIFYTGIGWTSNLLAYLDQPILAQKVSLVPIYERPINYTDRMFEEEIAVGRTFIPVFLCPAENRRFDTIIPEEKVLGFALKSYLGISGSGSLEDDGIFISEKRISDAEVLDGLSNTLMFGERPPAEFGPTGQTTSSSWYLSKLTNGTCEPVMLLYAGRNDAYPEFGFNCKVSREPLRPGQLGSGCHNYHFWSLHGGGATFGLADGSARFFRNEASSILPKMASRAGGEVFTLD